MKTRSLTAALMATVLCITTPVLAQPFGQQGPQGAGRPGSGPDAGPGRGGPGGGPGGSVGPGGPGGQQGMNRGMAQHRNGPPSRGRGGDGGYDHVDMNRVWRRGDRYDGPRNNRWVVRDWQNYRGLSAPPPGYEWMRYGNQYLLTALTTGVIAGVVSAAMAPPMR